MVDLNEKVVVVHFLALERVVGGALDGIGMSRSSTRNEVGDATVLMALLLANSDPAQTARRRATTITAAVRGVADWLGDTPAVARASYIDPRVISRYSSEGQLATIPRLPAVLPAAAEAELSVAALLAGDASELDVSA